MSGVGIPARSNDSEQRRLTDAEKAVVRRSVLVGTSDPDFAEFRWPTMSKSPAPTDYYCGQVNAQTAPGRWVGFRPFVVTIETVKGEIRNATLVDLSADRVETTSVISKCREHGLDAFATVESDGRAAEAQRRFGL